MVTEASTIGLAPGHWPRTITLDGVTLTATAREVDRGGELAAVIYTSAAGVRVAVLND